MAVVEARGLTKRFGRTVAVDDVGFDADAGTVTGFLGPNGAGKTTTLRMLLGLVSPTAGTATVAGAPYRSLPDPLRQVGAVLEASGTHPGRTARRHLAVQAAAGGIDRRRVDAVLDAVGLTDVADRRAGTYSLGLRQRLGLATALLGDPAVLVLDEPANGLDPEGVRWLRGLVRGMAAEGRTVLLSSHVLAEMARTVDRVVILDRGRLVTEATLAELTAGARGRSRVRTPRADVLRVALLADGADATLVGPDRLEVTGSTPERIAELAAGLAVPVVEHTTEAPGLEDAFLRLTGAAGTGGDAGAGAEEAS
ncbi:MAG TPA: ATP-binding cassette domain-containing protein [Acidimicrobiales bacterium]